MKRMIFLLGALAIFGGVAFAQQHYPTPADPGARNVPVVVPACINGAGQAVACGTAANPLVVSGTVTGTPSGTQNVAVTNFPASQPVSVANFPTTQAVSTTPNRGVATAAMATVGTTASALVAAGAARSHLMVQNQSTTAVLTCTFNGVAPVSGTTGIEIYPMGNVAASGMAGAFMPTGAVNCISNTAGTRVYVSYLQ